MKIQSIEVVDETVDDEPMKLVKIYLGEYSEDNWQYLRRLTGDLNKRFPNQDFDGYWVKEGLWVEYEVPMTLPVNAVLERLTKIAIAVHECVTSITIQYESATSSDQS